MIVLFEIDRKKFVPFVVNDHKGNKILYTNINMALLWNDPKFSIVLQKVCEGHHQDWIQVKSI